MRQEFLDKFFVALGWDVYHSEQPNPYEREVRIEKSVIVQGRGKRADYAFYTAPNFSQARFMAEAKKPKRIVGAFKAFAAKKLREENLFPNEFQIWSRGRSRRYLWKPRHVELAIDYVLYGQGDLPFEFQNNAEARTQ